jgi:hypothetical protein
MKSIYADHNILARDDLRQRLRDILTANKCLRLAISAWNFVEIASGSDKTQALRRADDIDQLQPLWLVERLSIQEMEVRRFVYQHFFGVSGVEVQALTPYLSVMLSFEFGSKVPLGLTAKRLVEEIMPHLAPIHEAKSAAVSALKTLQAATAKQKKQVEEEVFKQSVARQLPRVAPDDKAISPERQVELVQSCFDMKAQFHAECPAIAVEHAMYVLRSQDPKRNPEKQDAIDLQHGVAGLAYCDYFLTRDGFARHVAERVPNLISPVKAARVLKDVDELERVCAEGDPEPKT